MFRELVKFATNKSIRLVNNRSEWNEFLPPMLEPMLNRIEGMSDNERANLRTNASSEGGRLKTAKMLAKEIQDMEPGFAPGMDIDLGEEREDRDDKALIENAELNLRYYIRDKLKKEFGEKWYKRGIPPDVKKVIDEKVSKKVVKYPFLGKVIESTPDIKMDYTDIVNLGRIMTWSSNWELFKTTFQNEDNLNRKIEEFQAYRNEVFHLRTGDEMCRELGKLAIKWIQHCLGIDT